MIHARQAIVNRVRSADYPEGEVQRREIWDEQTAAFCDVEVARDALDHLAVVEAGVFVAGDLVGLA
jgi:hypothetical protein